MTRRKRVYSIRSIDPADPKTVERIVQGKVVGLKDEKFENRIDTTSPERMGRDIQLRRWGLKLLEFAQHPPSIRHVYEHRGWVAEVDGGQYLRNLEDLIRDPVGGESPRFLSPGQFFLEMRRAMRYVGVREEEIRRFNERITTEKKAIAPERIIEGVAMATGAIGISTTHVINSQDFVVPPVKSPIDAAKVEDEVVELFDAGVTSMTEFMMKRGDFPNEMTSNVMEFAKTLWKPEEVRELAKQSRTEKEMEKVRRIFAENEGLPDKQKKRPFEQHRKPFQKYFEGVLLQLMEKIDGICGGQLSYEDAGVAGMALLYPEVIGEAASRISAGLINADWAVSEKILESKKPLMGQDNDLAISVVTSLNSVENAIREHITGESTALRLKKYLASLPEGVVVVADDLSSIVDTSDFDKKIGGCVLTGSSGQSHASINLRKAEVPTVIKVGDALGDVDTGQTIIVVDEAVGDAGHGLVIVNPDPDTVDYYTSLSRKWNALREQRSGNTHLAAQTRDGRRLSLCANIDSPDDIATMIHGSIVQDGIEYSFEASNTHDRVKRVSTEDGVRSETLIFEGGRELDAPEGDETDRKVVEWVKRINVDREYASKQPPAGGDVRVWKRVRGAIGYGAEKVGLNRWEMWLRTLCQNRGGLPDPEELEGLIYAQAVTEARVWQSEAERNRNKYAQAHGGESEGIAHLSERIIPSFVERVPDYGRDKKPPSEMEPVLSGYGESEKHDPSWEGGVGFLLENKERILKPFMKAFMRLAAEHEVDIMVPMVMTGRDIQSMIEVRDECTGELSGRGGEKFRSKVKFVPLIEHPNAARKRNVSSMLKRHGNDIASVSIGTNDLETTVTQTTRDAGETINTLQVGVLEPIKDIVDAAHENGFRVTICGESGGRSQNTPVLLALGVDGLSMSGLSVPVIKTVIRGLDYGRISERIEEFMDLSAENPERLLEESKGIADETKQGAGIRNMIEGDIRKRRAARS